ETTPPYVDAGMDDEMIETNFVDRPADAATGMSEPEYSESPDSAYTGHEAQEVSEPSYDTNPNPSVETAGDLRAFESFAEDRQESGAATAPAPAETAEQFDEFSRTEQIAAYEVPVTARDSGLDELGRL